MNAQPVRSGSVLARRYRTTRRIASGAMGEVWEGVHVELGHRVAIKVLRQEALECREMLVRFAREAFLLARIQNEHVVRVIDFAPRGRHGPVLVMEVLDGPTFAERVHEGPVPIGEAIDVAIDVLRGLRAMHARRVIHRDVKPGNVVVQTLNDGVKRAVLIDLGVGRLLDEVNDDGEVLVNVGAEITTADRVVGTLEYMAPEQIASCQTAGPLVDVYAVGAMLFRAVAGAHPFGDKRGVDLIREKLRCPVPPVRLGRCDARAKKLEAIIARATAFLPRERFQSAEAMLSALESLRAETRAEVPTLADPEEVSTVGSPRVGLRRRKKALIALAAVCATAIAACSTEFVRRAPSAAGHEMGITVSAPP